MSKFVKKVKSIMELFKSDKENHWFSKTPMGKKWSADLTTDGDKSTLVMTIEDGDDVKTVKFTEDDGKKLFKTFKDLYRKKDLEETCSAGATCAGSVATFAKNVGKPCKRKRKCKKDDFDVQLFKEAMTNGLPCQIHINEHSVKHFLNNGKCYLGIDNCLVKTFDKVKMLESIDSLIDDHMEDIELLEDYSCYEMDLLMEEETPLDTEMTDMEKQQKEQDLNQKSQTKTEVAIQDEDNEDEIIPNQEILGQDEDTKEYIVKDKLTNKIKSITMDKIKDIQ